METKWKNTSKALEDLQNLLTCDLCSQLVEKPVSLGMCQHFFCQKCVENSFGEKCPQCDIPSHVRDVSTNRQLETAVTLCQELFYFIIQDSASPPTNQIEKSSSPVKPASSPKPQKEEKQQKQKLVQRRKKQDLVAIFNECASALSDGEMASVACASIESLPASPPTNLIEKSSSPVKPASSPKPPKEEKQQKQKLVQRRIKQDKVAIFNESASAIFNECASALSDGEMSSVACASPTDQIDEAPVEPASSPKSNHKEKQQKKKVLPNKKKQNKVALLKEFASALSEDTEEEAVLESNPVRRTSSRRSKVGKFTEQKVSKASGRGGIQNNPFDSDSSFRLFSSPPRENLKLKENAVKKSTPKGTPKSTIPVSTPKSAIPVSRRKQMETPRTPTNRELHTSMRSSPATPGLEKRNHKGETQLQIAALKGDFDQCCRLLKEGANVNTKDNAGWAPLHEASHYGFTAIVKLFLDHRAFVNIPSHEQGTPLHEAAMNNKLDIARLLMAHGADVNAVDYKQLTPLDICDTDEMRELLESFVETDTAGNMEVEMPRELLVTPPVIISVGLTREQKRKIQTCATKLNGRTVSEYSEQVTHLVTSQNMQGQCPRTLEFLKAVVQGKWIVSMDWIEICMEHGDRVNEEAFEIPGCSNCPDTTAPGKSRQNYAQKLPRLFDGCRIYLDGIFAYPFSKDDLCDLVRQGGGVLLDEHPTPLTAASCSDTPPFHYKDSASRKYSHFIVKQTNDTTITMINPELCVVPTEWLLQCIAKFEIITSF